jgi:hypothetical protein
MDSFLSLEPRPVTTSNPLSANDPQGKDKDEKEKEKEKEKHHEDLYQVLQQTVSTLQTELQDTKRQLLQLSEEFAAFKISIYNKELKESQLSLS